MKNFSSETSTLFGCFGFFMKDLIVFFDAETRLRLFSEFERLLGVRVKKSKNVKIKGVSVDSAKI